MKICTKCKIEKETSEFNKNKTCKDGLQQWCIRCLREYRIKNKEEIKKKKAKAYQENIEERNKRERERMKTPSYVVMRSLRGKIYSSVRFGYGKKLKHAKELIGCSKEELVKHLESKFDSKMSWDNYGRTGWHIDHIKPCACFDLTDIDQQKKCFNYTNLQPLWASDNCSKSAYYNGKFFHHKEKA